MICVYRGCNIQDRVPLLIVSVLYANELLQHCDEQLLAAHASLPELRPCLLITERSMLM